MGMEKLKGNTGIDIVGSWGLIMNAEKKGNDRDRFINFVDMVTY